ncbi:GNAT family N-acetyltransferase [Sediminitomix flava]|uniref:Acetyltransferase (GNAT) family protein n=1 Tax=Sediminitomix flava TaxID=379075 RepID=A0A315ZUH9_SEDFL|nr:GNAT family N-acetyltransferase [Sediminitomix flava]PWJ39299.1 acetyltransferase (GNAT) family protein [Sediminitomix flava]
MKEVTIYYLEMHAASELNAKTDAKGLEIRECVVKQFQYNKFLYQLIGGIWDWTDKLSESDEEWKAYAEADNLRTWVAYQEGSPAGYFELQMQEEGNVEIRYFGLAEKFLGKGLGGFFLSEALKKAWEWEGAKRVWVHTCSLDHPSALNNYKARGMKLYKTEIEKS